MILWKYRKVGYNLFFKDNRKDENMNKRLCKAAALALIMIAAGSCANKDTPAETAVQTASQTEQSVTEVESTVVSETENVTEAEQSAQETEKETSDNDNQYTVESMKLKELKDFKLTDSSGNEMLFSELIKGKPAVVNFWATWCPPCRHEMPFYEKYYKEYSDRMQFIMIDDWEEQADVEEFLDYNDYTFPVYYYTTGDVRDPDELNLLGVPVTAYFDENGELKASVKITFQEEDDFRKFLDLMSAGDYDAFDEILQQYCDKFNNSSEVTYGAEEFLIPDVPDIALKGPDAEVYTMSTLSAEKNAVFYFFDPETERYDDQNIKNMINAFEDYSSDAQLYLVSTAKERSDAEKLFEEFGIDYPLYSNNGKSITRALNIDYGQALISMGTDGKAVCTFFYGCYDPVLFPKFMEYTLSGDSEGWRNCLDEYIKANT